MKTRKLLTIGLGVLCSVSASFARPDGSGAEMSEITPAKQQVKAPYKMFVSLQGGAVFSANENMRAYANAGCINRLFTGQGEISLGYYFIPRLGVRLSAELARNSGAANYEQQQNVKLKFQPFRFKSFHAYADLVVNGGDVSSFKNFNWRLYAGLGLAHSYRFDSWPLKMYYNGVSESGWFEYLGRDKERETPVTHNCFSFRYGLMLEYIWDCGIGLVFDANQEWMTDWFDGMKPYDKYGKHISFPFDLKFNLNAGIVYHFL